MFDIGGSELLLIGIVALIAIGPKELPTMLRTLGQWIGKLRRMASEFQNQFQQAMREAEMADLKKKVEMTSQVQSYANFDPVGEVRREFQSAQQVETSRPVAAAEGGSPALVTSADEWQSERQLTEHIGRASGLQQSRKRQHEVAPLAAETIGLQSSIQPSRVAPGDGHDRAGQHYGDGI
jgi:Tat protein translocase TatB subunit